MKIYPKAVVIFSLAMLLGLITSFYTRRYVNQNLEKELSRFIPMQSSIPRNEQVLITLTRIDPIFSLEGADLAYLKVATEKLKENITGLENSGFWVEKDIERLSTLHPIEFLEMLPELEKLRREVASGNASAISEYNAHLSKTLSQYEKNLNAFQAELSELAFFDESGKKTDTMERFFYFVDSKSNFKTILDAISLLKTNLTGLRKTHTKRVACLGYEHICSRLLREHTFEVTKPTETADDAEHIIQKTKSVREVFDRIYPASELSHAKIFEVATPCFGSSTAHFYLLDIPYQFLDSRVEPTSKLRPVHPIFRPLLLDTMYFERFPQSVEYYRPLKERGFTENYQPATNIYACNDLTYYPRLLALRDLSTALHLAPLTLENITERNVALSLQDKLADGRIVRENEAETLIYTLSLLLETYGETILAEKVGNNEVLRIQSLIAQFDQRSAMFADIVAYGAYSHENFGNLLGLFPKGTIPMNYVFIARSAPSLFYLPFNQSVMATTPLFVDSTEQKNKGGHFTLSEMLKKYSQGTMLEIIRLSMGLTHTKDSSTNN